MELLLDYLGFLAKTATVVVAVLIIISAVAAASAHRAMRSTRPLGHIEVVPLNERLMDMRRAVEEAALPPAAIKKRRRQDAKARKRHRKEEARKEKARAKSGGQEAAADAPPQPAERKSDEAPASEVVEATEAAAATAESPESKQDEADRRVFVLDFNGDLDASAVESLRREISAVLGAASSNDEVLVRVESAGGAIHSYGLAASQLARIRSHGVQLTVAVDKVAASGGYLMAAVADRILAAPFAVVGSIGVVAQIPNVHRLLKKHDVDVEVLTAGRFKRTLDMLGENTEQGREKLREELEDAHALFQEHVGNWRPALDLDAVSTGEAWYGQRAMQRALVDDLITSDEYLARACNQADVFEVCWVEAKRPIDRLLGQAAAGLRKTVANVVDGLLKTGGIR